MKTKFLIGLLAAPLVFASLSMPALAKKKEPVTCADGTTSTAKGRGACSGHGGVKKDDAGPAASGAAAAPAAPAAAAAPASGGSVCKDGTTSEKTGRGACSGHGGVKKGDAGQAASGPAASGAAMSGAASAPAAAAAAPAAAAKSAPVAGAPAASRSSSTAAAGSGPEGATAKCKDGAYSHSMSHKGACSHHGGVDQWLKQ
ncbi:MAG: DUF3761 domain-containing protein [Steroidobacteraceae bacterium]